MLEECGHGMLLLIDVDNIQAIVQEDGVSEVIEIDSTMNHESKDQPGKQGSNW